MSLTFETGKLVEQTNFFIEERKKYTLKTESVRTDEMFISNIFKYIGVYYQNVKSEIIQNLTEPEISENIVLFLRNNTEFSSFGTNSMGFKVNAESSNLSKKLKGFYDIIIEHSDWSNNYFVFENKIIDEGETSMKEYIYRHPTKTRKEDGGLFRFLIGKYSFDMPFAGMLGFIKKGDRNKISENLKQKLESVEFEYENKKYQFEISETKTLNRTDLLFPDSFSTEYVRTNSQKIEIFHFLLDFTNR